MGSQRNQWAAMGFVKIILNKGCCYINVLIYDQGIYCLYKLKLIEYET